MDYILRDIDIELWSKVKAKATLERKTMREVVFESLKWYITPVEATATSDYLFHFFKRSSHSYFGNQLPSASICSRASAA